MRIIILYLRRYLGEHPRKHPWIVGLATAGISGFGIGFYLFQLLGILDLAVIITSLEAFLIFGWPVGKALSKYFQLQGLYHKEIENLSRPATSQQSGGEIAKEIEELYKAYTVVPGNRVLPQRTVEIPLYPPFVVSKPVALLLSLPCFLRLDRIEQLSFAHHIFEGAKHSRREHVLGVMYLVREVCNRFRKDGLLSERDTMIAEIAALLHDLFHSPYGHALDGVGKIGLREDHQLVPREWKYDRGRLILALKSESWFRLVLTSASLTEEEIEIILRIFRLQADDVEWLTKTGKYFFIANLIQGSSIDMDRLDYVNRDALHTFGTQDVLDYRRLLSYMESPDQSEWLVLYGEDAADLLRAAEVLRYKNFALVYESDVNASAEEMVSHAIFRLYKRLSLTPATLRQLLMLSEVELEQVTARHGGDFERWMVDKATHESRSYVSIAGYPLNLEDTVIETRSGLLDKINASLLAEIFSKVRIKELSLPQGGIDDSKAVAYIRRFSKKLKELQKTRLDPSSSTEAFIGKVLEEHKLSTFCFAAIKKQEAELAKRHFPFTGNPNSDEPIIFMRGAIEEPWTEDPVKILRVRGKSKSLSEYFSQRLVANPKVYRIRIFAPIELQELDEEIKDGFENYLMKEILPSE